MTLQIPSASNSESALAVSDAVFGVQYNEALVHQLVVAYMAGGRSGTKGQKTRSDVSGGGAKPWRQKGSGRARAGTSRSPLWRTGGVTFAARNRDFSQKLNKKMYRAAMRSIFSELLRQGRLVVATDLSPSEPKTKVLLDKLKGLGVDKGLLIADSIDNNLYLAARNIPHIGICDVNSLSPVALVHSEKVVITAEAAKKIEAGLS
ncbi:large subunit ribosomal protein L4 [Methylomagnum ishizawai]|uniref:Large ribosomal subunit protein uL4 n=1 Tax=Methylomagnum ishizawai TaxID=1760988 RepID=A0A1Y6DAU5_9GAMM|nr:50S ribosomal protein L4 [Methylomagnum ishizawai]SMF96775.1 large subunit ribosomal protein L4 [Methylomagnum ishizawai]